jgi:carboxymethylenebutenolidase
MPPSGARAPRSSPASGFASPTVPHSRNEGRVYRRAERVRTDQAGLDVRSSLTMTGSIVDVATEDGVADCYLARPDGDADHPAVLFMIDAIGLRARTEEMADRIAAAGYVVLAPNVFYRAGRAPLWETPDLADPEARGTFMRSLGPLMTALRPDRVAADGGAYLDQLAAFADGPVGITGYCFGGWLGWTIAAAHRDRVAALGGFHAGRMVTDEDDSPHLLAPQIAAEVYWGNADQDQSMTPENIAALDRAMDDAGVRHTTELYAGAAHGYTMSDMGAFNEAACERHFEALLALLRRALPS